MSYFLSGDFLLFSSSLSHLSDSCHVYNSLIVVILTVESEVHKWIYGFFFHKCTQWFLLLAVTVTVFAYVFAMCTEIKKKWSNRRTIGVLNFGVYFFFVQMINRIAIYKHHFAHAHTDMVCLFLVTTLSIIITLGITFKQTFCEWIAWHRRICSKVAACCHQIFTLYHFLK